MPDAIGNRQANLPGFSFSILNSRPPIPVVCALILDATGRVLVAQRPPHKHLGLKWEFPGGKVEANEEPASALIREIREELACDLEILRALPAYDHDYTSVVIHMLPFLCRLAPGSPTPQAHEHVGLRWVTPAELATLDLAPADIPLLALLADEAQRQPPS